MTEEAKKKGLSSPDVRREVRDLVWRHRRYLAIGFVLMVISRLAGLVLPLSARVLQDDIIIGKRADLLLPLAAGVGIAALIQAATSFGLSQVISVSAQRAIRRCAVAWKRMSRDCPYDTSIRPRVVS
jgi:subfamily B ATP-binding cassette protein MsbA